MPEPAEPARTPGAGNTPRAATRPSRLRIVLRSLWRAATAPSGAPPWREVLESSPDLVFAKDLDGRYVAANQAFCDFAGIPRHVLLGMRDTDHADDVSVHARAARERVVGTGQPLVIDLEMRHQGTRERRTYNAVLAPLVRDGRVAGVSCFARDVTERIRVEKELRDARAAAEAASASKSRFLAATSHDLRQPMQGALLFAAGLEGAVEGEAARAGLANLHTSLDTLKALLDQMFDLARMESGTVSPVLADVPLAPLLDELRAAWEPVARAKGLGLAVVGSSLSVRTDPVLLGRMLRNLLENAVRYTDRGRVLLDCVPGQDGRVEVVVSDTGPGIPAGQLDLIWEEFRQLGGGRGERGAGLGLGLSIVRHMSRLLDHPVSVSSVPGRGTSFSVSIPVAGEARAAHPVEAAVPAAGPIPGGARILVLEDDPLVLLSLRTLLEAWGSEVVDTCPDGAAGRAREFRPDVVLSDYRLPGASGVEAVAEIRAALGRDVPAAILTGHTGGEVETAAGAAGLALIRKPVSAARLAAVLDALLGRRPVPGE